MAEMIQTKQRLIVFKDKPDNRILECAVWGEADIIVTGDKEMLRLKNYKGIKLVSLKEYLDIKD